MPQSARQSLPSLILNVPALAGRSEAEVSAYLGEPDPGTPSTDPTRKKVCYRGGKVEVVFAEGKAGWIKLYGNGDLPFSRQSLSKLGLPVKRPTYVNAGHVMSWDNVLHLREVSLYGGGPGGSVSSVLVCVHTAPKSSAQAARPHRLSLLRLQALG